MRFVIDVPAGAMVADNVTIWPVFWSVETNASNPAGGQRFLWEGYPAWSDPIRAGCVPGEDCTIIRYVPVWATRLATPAVNELTATMVLDYLAPPFPDPDSALAIAIDTPTAWYDETFTGRTPAEEDQAWLIEFRAGSDAPDGQRLLPLLATVGYRRNAFDYVDVANTFGCNGGTCSLRLEVPGSDVPWTGGLHWPFFGPDVPPEGFAPESPPPEVFPYPGS